MFLSGNTLCLYYIIVLDFVQEDKKNLHFAHGRFIDKFCGRCYNNGIKNHLRKELSSVIKKCLLLLCALAVQAAGLASCEGIPQGAFVSEVGTVSDQPDVSVTVSDDTRREYLSTEGDGEILCLYEDGSFLAYTVIDLSAEGESGSVCFFLTETTEGVYTEDGDAVRLEIKTITYSVTGLEEYPQLADLQAATVAGENEDLRRLYAKLFGGEELDGRELLGEERYTKLLESKNSAQLHADSFTFTYSREKTQ